MCASNGDVKGARFMKLIAAERIRGKFGFLSRLILIAKGAPQYAHVVRDVVLILLMRLSGTI